MTFDQWLVEQTLLEMIRPCFIIHASGKVGALMENRLSPF